MTDKLKSEFLDEWGEYHFDKLTLDNIDTEIEDAARWTEGGEYEPAMEFDEDTWRNLFYSEKFWHKLFSSENFLRKLFERKCELLEEQVDRSSFTPSVGRW